MWKKLHKIIKLLNLYTTKNKVKLRIRINKLTTIQKCLK